MTRPHPASRTRQINTLLGLILAACVGVIYLDQTGKMGGTPADGSNSSYADVPAKQNPPQAQPGTDIQMPDLNGTETPAEPTPDTTAPSTPAPPSDQPTPTTTPETTPSNSDYGNLK